MGRTAAGLPPDARQREAPRSAAMAMAAPLLGAREIGATVRDKREAKSFRFCWVVRGRGVRDGGEGGRTCAETGVRGVRTHVLHSLGSGSPAPLTLPLCKKVIGKCAGKLQMGLDMLALLGFAGKNGSPRK